MRASYSRKGFRDLTHNIKVILKHTDSLDESGRSPAGGDKWLYENKLKLCLIGRHTAAVIGNIAPLPLENGTPRIYGICSDMLKEFMFSLDENNITSYIVNYQSGGSYLTINELLYLREFIIASCFFMIAGEIEGELSENGMTVSAVRLIYEIDDIDFTHVYETVSHSESVLIRDPAGVYLNCDEATKNMYRRKLAQICRTDKTDEYETVQMIRKHAEESEGAERHIGYHLLKYTSPRCGILYFAALYSLPALLCAVLAVCSYISEDIYLFLSSFLVYLPIRMFLKAMIGDMLAGKHTADILPRLHIDDIPVSGKTLLTYTVVLRGDRSDDSVFKRVKNYALAYKSENLGFAVLADLPDCDSEHDNRDAELIDRAKKHINEISALGGKAFFIYRAREYSKTERKYIGLERKRGAQEELFRAISGERSKLFIYGGSMNDEQAAELLTQYRYVLALDSDTTILYSDIKKLIATALHPYNQPSYSSGRGYPITVSGCGVIVPEVKISLRNIDKWNMYTLLRYSYGGRSSYEAASFMPYMYLFSRGCFCGKGLISVDAYMRTVAGAFPKERILSHDIAEGIRLRCGFASDIRISDNVPAGFLQERKRSHRWMRGDLQALCLCGLHVRSGSGIKYKNPASVTDKLILSEPIVDIAYDIVCPIATVLPLLSGSLFGFAVFLIAALPFLYKLFSYLANIIREGGIPYRKYESGIPNYYNSACFDLWRTVSSAADRMCCAADAAYRVIYRVKISKRHMLQWTTAAAADAQASRGPASYTAICSGSIMCGAAASLLAIFRSSVGVASIEILIRAILLIIGALWLSYPIILYFINRAPAKKRPRDANTIAVLLEDARRMWRFFADNVTKSHPLPPDNISYMPENVTAERTSPTNIGMYLLSSVNAHDLGFIGDTELYERLNDTISAVYELERWHGHLYNWYNTESREVLYPAYVSTVDSGNFICSLVIIKNAIRIMGDKFKELAERIENIISETDFSALYNRRRGLFYIGYNGKSGQYDKNVYDLYASEMLTTSFYAAATGAVPAEHISSLRRLFYDEDAYEVMLSWSGSTFEYFMPNIFLPAYMRTERGESLLNSYKMQRKSSIAFAGRKIYGRSESAFYDYDDNMNYSYKAHGCKKLALSENVGGETVISPYSLYLMSSYDEDIGILLASLRDSDLYGKYGLYESIDMTPSRVGEGYGIARLYMSHHIGMSIAAAANTCLSDINIRRFMSEPALSAQAELLFNRVVINRAKTVRSDHITAVRPPKLSVSADENTVIKSETAVISNGRIKCIAKENGCIAFYDGKKLITQPLSRGCGSFRAMIKADGEIYDCINSESLGIGAKSSFYTDGAAIFYQNEMVHGQSIIKTELRITCDPHSPSCVVSLDIHGDIKELSTLYLFYPVINTPQAYYASPTYSDLFIMSEHKPPYALRYKRKGERNGTEVTVSFIGDGCSSIKLHTKADELLPFAYGSGDIAAIFDMNETSCDGACIHPACAAVISQEAKASYRTGFTIRCDNAGGEYEEAIVKREQLDEMYEKMKLTYRVNTALAGADISAVKCAMTLAAMIYAEKYHIIETDLSCDELIFNRDIFWRYGISGDLPIITIFTGDMSGTADKFALAELIAAKRFLFCLGVRFDFVISAESASYGDTGKDIISDMAAYHGCGHIMNRTNGIFIIGKETLSRYDELIFAAFSRGYIDIGCEHEFKIIKSETHKPDCHISEFEVRRGIKYRRAGEAAVIYNGSCASPWSMVYCNNIFGTLITNKTCGFSWYNNSSESKITSRHIDYLCGAPGETVYFKIGNAYYDLARDASYVIYSRECAVYTGNAAGISYELRIGVDSELPAKLYHIKAIPDPASEPRAMSGCDEEVSVELFIYPACDMLLYKNTASLLSDDDLIMKTLSVSEDISERQINYGTFIGSSASLIDGECGFVIFASPKNSYKELASHLRSKFYTPQAILCAFDEYKLRADDLLLPAVYRGEDKWLSGILPFASYQAVYMRMLARCGYSQPGGAYGFRDQLQDSLAALYFCSDITKRQIFRSCAHQFTDGTVQHWWHPRTGDDIDNIEASERGDRGLRTKCSDDYMWLPYAAAKYVISTGDTSIFDREIFYIESSPLSDEEEDRYESPLISDERKSVYDHCMRAVYASFSRGAHGLPKMGTGDWNDGMNRVGAQGRGESVWLAFFFAAAYKKFASAAVMYGGRDEDVSLLNDEAERLIAAAEKYAWDGEWYLRAFDDDGQPLGSVECAECKLDLLPQAFAVFAGADAERRKIALRNVYERLYDKERGILRLFAPSYSRTDKYGYICNYPAGVRENGGQYTHAAIWCAAAFFEQGEFDIGAELLRALSPERIYKSGGMSGKYTAEPYFLAADIYYGGSITGKSGWSGYTGSAAWYYRVAMKYYLGITIEGGGVIITPNEAAGDHTVFVRVGECEFEITVTHLPPKRESYDLLYKISYGESVKAMPDGEKVKISVLMIN